VKLARFRRPRAAFFSHMWTIDPIQIQQHYKKQVMLREATYEGEGKRRKSRK
jgi:hypothetical protein